MSDSVERVAEGVGAGLGAFFAWFFGRRRGRNENGNGDGKRYGPSLAVVIERLDGQKRVLDAIDTNVQQLVDRVGHTEKRLDTQIARVDNLEERIERLKYSVEE